MILIERPEGTAHQQSSGRHSPVVTRNSKTKTLLKKGACGGLTAHTGPVSSGVGDGAAQTELAFQKHLLWFDREQDGRSSCVSSVQFGCCGSLQGSQWEPAGGPETQLWAARRQLGAAGLLVEGQHCGEHTA